MEFCCTNSFLAKKSFRSSRKIGHGLKSAAVVGRLKGQEESGTNNKEEAWKKS